jgi:hypothetical protein
MTIPPSTTGARVLEHTDDDYQHVDGNSNAVVNSDFSPFDGAAVNDGEEGETGAEARSLTRGQIWNLTFCILAWACTICSITLSKYTN